MKTLVVVFLGIFAIYCGAGVSGNPDNSGCGTLNLFSSLSEYRLWCGEEYTGKNKVVPSGLDNTRMAKQLAQWEKTGYDPKWKPDEELK